MVDTEKDNLAEPTPELVTAAEVPLAEVAPVAALPEPMVGETATVADPTPVKRKAGRPRKDAAKPEAMATLANAPAAVLPETSPATLPVTKKPVAKARPGRPAKAAPVAKSAKVAKPTQKPVPVTKAPAPKVVRVKPLPIRTPVKPAPVNIPVAPASVFPKDLFTMTATTDITDKLQTAVKDATEKAKAAFEKSQAAFGDVGEFTKGNVEAVVASSKIFATGLQEMGKSYVSESKGAFETMSAELKDLTTVKSPTEFFEKQSALMRKHFDAAVAASSKNSEAMLKLASEAFQPISTRVSLAVEKVKQAA
jgi:phasin family protein